MATTDDPHWNEKLDNLAALFPHHSRIVLESVSTCVLIEKEVLVEIFSYPN